MSLPDCRPEHSTVTGRGWRNLDAAEADWRLYSVDWSPIFTSDDPSEQWDYFSSVTLSIIDELNPVKRIQMRNPTAPQ